MISNIILHGPNFKIFIMIIVHCDKVIFTISKFHYS